MKFDWDDDKAKRNLQNRGIGFEEASAVFEDFWAIETFDEIHSTVDEKRFTMIGLANTRLLRVTYTVREDVNSEEIIRIISARTATGKDKENYEYIRKRYDRF